jgi:hypothetical protein
MADDPSLRTLGSVLGHEDGLCCAKYCRATLPQITWRSAPGLGISIAARSRSAGRVREKEKRKLGEAVFDGGKHGFCSGFYVKFGKNVANMIFDGFFGEL